jgi:hypothetical protein
MAMTSRTSKDSNRLSGQRINALKLSMVFSPNVEHGSVPDWIASVIGVYYWRYSGRGLLQSDQCAKHGDYWSLFMANRGSECRVFSVVSQIKTKG